MDNYPSQDSANQEQIKQYEVVGSVYLVPLIHIYVDHAFNCRGHFTHAQVFDLARDIEENGQLVPLVIQPMEDVPPEERPDPCFWPYRLIAGHRRYVGIDAWTPLETAKCTIEYGLSRLRARALNFTENLQRKDLNLLEEAQGLRNTWGDEEIKDVSRWVRKPKRWVQIRRDLMRMPEYVQKKAAAGTLSEYDIETLAGVPDNQLEEVYQKLVVSKRKKNSAPVVKGRQGWRNRSRGKKEANKTISFLSKNYEFAGLSAREKDLVLSTIAWMARGIDSKEFLENRLAFPDDCVTIDDVDKIVRIKDT